MYIIFTTYSGVLFLYFYLQITDPRPSPPILYAIPSFEPEKFSDATKPDDCQKGMKEGVNRKKKKVGKKGATWSEKKTKKRSCYL